MKSYLITVKPYQKTLRAAAADDLLSSIRSAGLPFEGTCGGRGSCGKCKLTIQSGQRNAFTTAEQEHLTAAERDSGLALACQCRPESDLVVELPAVTADLSRKTKGHRQMLAVETTLRKEYLELKQPAVSDPRSDEKRFLDALAGQVKQPLPLAVLEALPSVLRAGAFQATAVIDGDAVAAVEEGDTRSALYGAAFDIGTTTVVGTLINLNSGEVAAVSSHTNSQNAYGADVISRIQFVMDNAGGLDKLKQIIIQVLNKILQALAGQAGTALSNIYQITAVGNTTMTHLLLGIDPSALAPAPFVPAFQKEVVLRAKELQLTANPGARVVVLPNIAGYLGSDTLAMMLAADFDTEAASVLAIDIGTNGELALVHRGRIWACSTAAGPAFEGAQIQCGMRAVDGAIEKVTIEQNQLKIEVIGGRPAVGICGSGLIDACAQLVKTGIVSASGRLLAPEELPGDVGGNLAKRLRRGETGRQFVLAYGQDGSSDVVLTQKDIRELQLAKGALRAGMETLLKEAGIAAAGLDKIILAGAFGNYINKESAATIGLLPAVTLDKVHAVGNAAGEGALLALASETCRRRVGQLATSVNHVELSLKQEFQEAFVEAMTFRLTK